MSVIIALLFAYLGMYVVVLLHELSHFIAALVLGLIVTDVVVGSPFYGLRVQFNFKGINFEFHPKPMSGRVSVTEMTLRTGWKLGISALSGPLFGLISSAMLGALILHWDNHTANVFAVVLIVSGVLVNGSTLLNKPGYDGTIARDFLSKKPFRLRKYFYNK